MIWPGGWPASTGLHNNSEKRKFPIGQRFSIAVRAVIILDFLCTKLENDFVKKESFRLGLILLNPFISMAFVSFTSVYTYQIGK